MDDFIEDDFKEGDDFQEDEPKLQGKIEPTENFLQRAMRNSGAFQRGFSRSATFGLSDLADVGTEKLMNTVLPQSPETKQKVNEMVRPQAPVAEGIGMALPMLNGVSQIGKAGINFLFGRQIAKAKLPGASKKLSQSITLCEGHLNIPPVAED